MSNLVKQEYDPHLLYHAINITVELEYKVQMERVYRILEILQKKNKKVENITPQEILNLLNLLGNNLENTVLSDEPSDSNNLQAKIKELLRLLGCVLSDKELNQILKGEVSIDDVLSKEAKLVWLMIFGVSEEGRPYPNKEMVEHMLLCTHSIAVENVEKKMQIALENYRTQVKTREQQEYVLKRDDNMKTLYRAEKEKYDPIKLEEKLNKLRLYIAHMQGYDRDRDRDGGRGIDMKTGLVIDFGDIYIADKEHGSVIEDIERDGIEISDIR